MSMGPRGRLYVVGTPIGNLQDITFRALETLKQVAIVACEDRRVSQILMRAYGVTTPLWTYHDHNAANARPKILEKLKAGESIALISDAGMPMISDPGYKLVEACVEEGIPVTVIPGVSASLTALCAAALPTDRFFFQGFLPPKKGAKRSILEELGELSASLIFFEAPHRTHETLCVLREVLGNRRAALSRELTKKFEQICRERLDELITRFEKEPPRGEVTIVVEGALEKRILEEEELDVLIQEALQHTSFKEAVENVTLMTKTPKRLIYQRALRLRK